MQLGIFERTANLLCSSAKLSSGHYTAEDMRALVAAWPEPEKALQLMQVDADTLPVLFADVPFQFVGSWLMGLMNEGTAMWPVVWVPEERLNDWHEDTDAQTLLGYLVPNKLGLGITKGPEGTVRGYRARLCDFRLMFLDGYDYASRTA